MILHYMHFFLHRRRVHILQHDIFLVKSCMFTLAVSLDFNLTREGQHIQRWRHLVTSKHFRIKVIFQCQWNRKLLICHIGQLMDIDHSFFFFISIEEIEMHVLVHLHVLHRWCTFFLQNSPCTCMQFDFFSIFCF